MRSQLASTVARQAEQEGHIDVLKKKIVASNTLRRQMSKTQGVHTLTLSRSAGASAILLPRDAFMRWPTVRSSHTALTAHLAPHARRVSCAHAPLCRLQLQLPNHRRQPSSDA